MEQATIIKKRQALAKVKRLFNKWLEQHEMAHCYGCAISYAKNPTIHVKEDLVLRVVPRDVTGRLTHTAAVVCLTREDNVNEVTAVCHRSTPKRIRDMLKDTEHGDDSITFLYTGID